MKTSTDPVTMKGLPSFNMSNAISPTPAASKANGSLTPFKVAPNVISPVAMSKKGIKGEMKPMNYKADNAISPTAQ